MCKAYFARHGSEYESESEKVLAATAEALNSIILRLVYRYIKEIVEDPLTA